MVGCGLSRPPERIAVRSDTAPTAPSTRLPATLLRRFTADALVAVGLPAKDPALSPHPIAVAAPGDGGPIVLDMATTVAAYGKVKTAVQRGETLPEGWMIDHQGRPLTDPKRADQGLLVPIGGYKGYGLALVFGLLAGTLNGAAMGSETVDFNADDVTPTNTGHAIVAISIAAFGEVDAFKG